MTAVHRRRFMGTNLTYLGALFTFAASPVVAAIIVLVLAGGPA